MNNFIFTRSFDLCQFIANMSEIQDCSQNIVDEHYKKVQSLKSAPLSGEERKRRILQDSGENLDSIFNFVSDVIII